MDAFDRVEELLLAEGYSKEEIPAIMVSLVEQGFDPTAVFLGGIANMLNLLPKKRQPEPLPKTKSVPSLLPDKLQPQAPKPEFGNNAAKPQPRVPKPELRPGGRTPEPQFRVTQPTNNVTPRRNNLSLQRTNLRAPSIPNPPVRAPGLFSRLKGIRGGPLSTAVNLATGAALDKYVVEPVGKAGGDALARGILDITGKGDRARQVNPGLYGKSGPTLTGEIVQGIRSRDAATASVQPKVDPTPKADPTPKPLSPAAKDFDANFAAARKAGKKEFTWRGKQYHTRLKGE